VRDKNKIKLSKDEEKEEKGGGYKNRRKWKRKESEEGMRKSFKRNRGKERLGTSISPKE